MIRLWRNLDDVSSVSYTHLDVYKRQVDITAKLGITPFATLPYMRTAEQIRRRRAIIGFGFALVLLAIPAGLWLVHTQIMPLDLLLDRALQSSGLSQADLAVVPV